MARGFALGLTWFATLGTILSACSADPNDGAASNSEQELGTFQPSGGAHIMMPLQTGIKTDSPPANAKLVYYGGPVISNVKVWTVFWGPNVPDQASLNQFYLDITNSRYMDWLNEYKTPQTIGRGSFGGSVVDLSRPAGTTITDAQIQGEITRLISAGLLPPNDANNLYMVHFPPGITITMQGASSCQQFCGYHGTYTLNGKNVYYGVMPDLSGGCGGGYCGGAPTKLQNQTMVASHQLIEAVTDSAIGLTTQVGPPLAWYDGNNGEIGDICNGQPGIVGAWTVQRQFSNTRHACMATVGGDGVGNCAHDVCSTGAKLSAICNGCVAAICRGDSFCCGEQWDAQCVSEAKAICGQCY